jgi:hypothetical protein
MEANTRNLERIFDQTISYQIPLFQRPYVWNEEDNWQPLWEDIQLLMDKSLIDGRAHSHFLGAVVLEQVNNATGSIEARQVIDGQQRLTTLQLFLLAAKDLCQYIGADKYFERFTDLTSNKASRIDTKEEAYKVWPTNCDREAFSRTHGAGSPVGTILEFAGKKDVSRVNNNIPDAYLYFSEQLKLWFAGKLSDTDDESSYPDDERLEALWQVVRSHLQIVVIDLGSDDESQVIFETLNARGTQLLPGDLIKNYLFHKAENGGEAIEDLYNLSWRDFDDPNGKFWREEVKQGRLKRPRIDLFMQHYLTLHTQDDVRVTHIFNTFKYFAEHYKAKEGDTRILPATPGEHLEALSEYGQVYRKFFKPDSSSRLGVFLMRLTAVDTATVYPFLLEACYTLQEEHLDELERILVWLESFLIRRMICGLTGKNYNRLFIDLIKAVQTGDRITEQAVIKFLLRADGDSTRFPTDKEFEAAWLMHPSYQRLAQYKVRAVLGALDVALETSKSESLGLPDGLTIEHVMPVSWEKNWPLDLKNPDDPEEKIKAKETRQQMLHTLGNLTLITSSLNPSLSNGAWVMKKPELIKFSKLNLNRYFHDHETWDEDEIFNRGEVLLKLAMIIWPYPTIETE